jgi:hypothetical protein
MINEVETGGGSISNLTADIPFMRAIVDQVRTGKEPAWQVVKLAFEFVFSTQTNL